MPLFPQYAYNITFSVIEQVAVNQPLECLHVSGIPRETLEVAVDGEELVLVLLVALGFYEPLLSLKTAVSQAAF